MNANTLGTKKGCRNVAVWLDDQTVENVDCLARKIGITRSKMLGNLVCVGLDCALLLEKLGILPVALVFKKLKEALNESDVLNLEILKKTLR